MNVTDSNIQKSPSYQRYLKQNPTLQPSLPPVSSQQTAEKEKEKKEKKKKSSVNCFL